MKKSLFFILFSLVVLSCNQQKELSTPAAYELNPIGTLIHSEAPLDSIGQSKLKDNLPELQLHVFKQTSIHFEKFAINQSKIRSTLDPLLTNQEATIIETMRMHYHKRFAQEHSALKERIQEFNKSGLNKAINEEMFDLLYVNETHLIYFGSEQLSSIKPESLSQITEICDKYKATLSEIHEQIIDERFKLDKAEHEFYRAIDPDRPSPTRSNLDANCVKILLILSKFDGFDK